MVERQLFLSVSLAVWLVCTASISGRAQQGPPQPPSPEPLSSPAERPDNHPDSPPDRREFRRRDKKDAQKGGPFEIDKLPPPLRRLYENGDAETQEKIREKFMRWQNLTPEQRKEAEDRMEKLRKEIRQDIDPAILQSGLKLSDEEKQNFRQRYQELRKQLEFELRQRMDEERQKRIPIIVEQIVQEFRNRPAPAKDGEGKSGPSPTPATDI